MRVIDRLNALDERAGIGTPSSPRAWEQSLRFWWLGPAIVAALILGLSALSMFGDTVMGVWMALPFLPVTFWAGFFYNERLRALGRRPRFGRVPASWPHDTA